MIKCSASPIYWCSRGGRCKECEYYKKELEKKKNERNDKQRNVYSRG
jgi:hypothetical protein